MCVSFFKNLSIHQFPFLPSITSLFRGRTDISVHPCSSLLGTFWRKLSANITPNPTTTLINLHIHLWEILKPSSSPLRISLSSSPRAFLAFFSLNGHWSSDAIRLKSLVKSCLKEEKKNPCLKLWITTEILDLTAENSFLSTNALLVCGLLANALPFTCDWWWSF